MANTMNPGKGDSHSVRNVSQTADDRREQIDSFRARKTVEQKHKDERFAAIREKRKNRPGDGGINIEVTSD